MRLILFFSFLTHLFFINIVYSQANVTSSGISIQGIARDENNTALTNESNLDISLKLYYLDDSNVKQTILNQTGSVNTDSFGVFHYVFTIQEDTYIKIANSEAYLEISQNSIIISDEKLHAVPYAIHSQNGAPTGTITAWIGTTTNIPAGWLYCNGQSIATGSEYATLRNLIGDNVPDLKAMFLRGSGNQTITFGNENRDYTGTPVMTTQQDQIINHKHGVNLTADASGEHNHAIRRDSHAPGGTISANDGYAMMSSNSYDEGFYPNNTNSVRNEDLMKYDGEHTHQVTGNTGNSGDGNETRPVNYGVYWIIKI